MAAYLRGIIPAIVEAGHRVSVFAYANEKRDFMIEDGRVSVHHFRLPSKHWYAAKVPFIRNFAPLPVRQLEWSLTFYRQVARVAARDKIDVIESSEAGALFLHRIAPTVIRLHGSEMTFRRHLGTTIDLSVQWNDSLEARACWRAAAITAPSEVQAREIAQRRGWPKERIQVIPNPISPSILTAAREFQRNGNSERIVLYTGRLAPVKGIETLLEAAKLVHAKDPTVRFVLAGPWQMPSAPETYGLKLNETSLDGVQWIGPRTQTDLIEWYKRASVFVMPSFFESFGISMVEAMAFGLAIIATRAASSAVDSNLELSFIFEQGDSFELAIAITRMFANPSLRMSSQKRMQSELVLRDFAHDRIASQTLSAYQTL